MMSLVTSAATKLKKDLHWNAADYAANSAAQQIWARELIAQLQLRGNEHVLDVGCGDGRVTAELVRAVPKGSVTGIDTSPEMIRFARKTFPSGKHPNLEFQVMDARNIRLARRFDVVFSSSVLHWVADHPAFLRGAAACLRPGGRLAVSCGGKGNAQDVFVALRPEMRLKQWCIFFRKMGKPYFFHSPAEYERWLPRFGFKTHRIRLSPKDAVYQGRDRFAAWLRTTWLPYIQRVPEDLCEEFISAVTDRYVAKHPPDADGRVHVRMVRLEIDAVKK
ncbi:MAG: methyltransferase domain-containing protein [Verrucomicrobiota bacterium]|jgi:trans-aconitate methyltransferase